MTKIARLKRLLKKILPGHEKIKTFVKIVGIFDVKPIIEVITFYAETYAKYLDLGIESNKDGKKCLNILAQSLYQFEHAYNFKHLQERNSQIDYFFYKLSKFSE